MEGNAFSRVELFSSHQRTDCARQNGSSPEEAAAAGDRYMEEVFHVSSRCCGSMAEL
jgi:hypothetical protein